MRTVLILACLLVILGSAKPGFGQALHPLYKDKAEEVFEPGLLGTWVSCSNAFPVCVEFQFERSADVGYRFIQPISQTPKVDLVYSFHLVRLGDALFGDLKLTDIAVAGQSQHVDLGGQFHRISCVRLKGGKLNLNGVDFGNEETQNALAANGIHLQLQTLDDGSLLALDSTAELQKFAKKMANDKRVFFDDSDLVRPENDQK